MSDNVGDDDKHDEYYNCSDDSDMDKKTEHLASGTAGSLSLD